MVHELFRVGSSFIHHTYKKKTSLTYLGLFLVLLHTFSIGKRLKFSLVSQICLYDPLLWARNGWLSWWSVGVCGFANYRIGGRIHPHFQAFVHGYLSQSSYRLTWDCMDSKEPSMLVVVVVGSCWYVNRFCVDDLFIHQTLDPHLMLELFRVGSTLWIFLFLFCPLGLLTGSGFMSSIFLSNFSFF